MAENSPPKLLPNWLNGDFLEKQLQNYHLDESVKLMRFDVKPAMAKGDGYLSAMFRVTVYYTDAQLPIDNQSDARVINLIVKAELDTVVADESLSYDMYSREIDVYANIVPHVNATLRRLGDEQQLLPRMIGACRTNKVLVLEDLKDMAYQCYPLDRCFNLAEAKVAVQRIATFHAVCAHLNVQQPRLFDGFQHGVMEEVGTADVYFLSQFDALVDVSSKWSNFDHYAAKLRQFRDNLMPKEREALKINPKHLNTLIHGDLWMNNIMIRKTNANQLENMIFIDFQFSCWASPSIDLHNLFTSSLDESVRRNNSDELVDYYHGCLVSLLTQLNYPKTIPTLQEFRQKFHEKSIHGFLIYCLEQPALRSENKADFDTLGSNDEHAMEYKRLCYQSPQIEDDIRYSISYYDQLGLFDC